MGEEQERMMSLFHEALSKRPGQERERYLAEACGGEDPLRKQVGALLQAHTVAGDFLKPPADDPPEADGLGTVIGRYKLLQLIGEGGFGRV